MKIDIGTGLVFTTKAAAKAHFSTMLRSHAVGDELSVVEAAQLAGLIERHPSRDEKVGAGIAAFTVMREERYGGQCFGVRRVDGTCAHFSFYECITASSHRAKVLSAARAAVDDDVADFRARVFGGNRNAVVSCAVTGVEISWDGAHVDHAPPTFLELVDSWRGTRAWDDIPVADNGDTRVGSDLLPADRESFLLHHRRHARLRMVSIKANLSDLRRKKLHA